MPLYKGQTRRARSHLVILGRNFLPTMGASISHIPNAERPTPGFLRLGTRRLRLEQAKSTYLVSMSALPVRAEYVLGRADLEKATPVRWIGTPLDYQCEA